MPALVNYGGEDDFCTGGSVLSFDPGLLFSINSHAHLFSPARKRPRITGPFVSLFKNNEKPSIEVLPDECLFEIFRRLQRGQDRSSSACVSKRWLMILSQIRNSDIAENREIQLISPDENQDGDDDGFLTRCVDGKKASDLRLAAIAVGTTSKGGLGKLSIRGSNQVSSLGLSAIARGCSSLKSLSLWNVPSVDDKGLIEIARECHNLRKLDLCHCPLISNKSLVAIAENCPNLNSLTVESCSNIGNECLQAIGRFCNKLQSVSIKDCSLVGDLGIAGILSSPSSVLKKVKLENLNVSDFSLAVIGHYGKSISSIFLSGLNCASQKGFWAMGNAKGLLSLSSLTITSCRGATDASLEAIGRGCPSLKILSLRKCCFVSDNGLVAVSKTVPALEGLHLEECNRITQQGILSALSNSKSKLKSLSLVKCMGIKDFISEADVLSPCQSLRSLTIQNCLGFGSGNLGLVGKFCPKLQNLNLSGLCGITDSGVICLLEAVDAGLVKVDFSYCLNLSDEAVLALARIHGSTLEMLNLEGCRKITDESLGAIAENCPFLRDLDFSKCSITDMGISNLAHGARLNLQVLSLSGCYRVSDKSVNSLRKLGKTLLGLNLQHCSSISSYTIEILVENLWRCDILS